jgi:hypothetical protein
MENKRIRQITEAIHGREPLFILLTRKNLPINGKYEKRTIFQIEEIENHYRIHRP